MKLSHSLAALSLLALGATAKAEVTGTITAISDYDFRGVTQSAQDPALQGSIDYANDSGWYIGAWASNIDFGDSFDADIEVDAYTGFRGGEDITWDVGFIYYAYPGESDADYQEIYAGIGYKALSGKIWYSDEVAGFDNDDGIYVEANANFELLENFGLSLHVGQSSGDGIDNLYGDSYVDYSVGMTYALGNFTLGLKWVDGSDLDALDGTPDDISSSEARAIFSVSTTFPWSSE